MRTTKPTKLASLGRAAAAKTFTRNNNRGSQHATAGKQAREGNHPAQLRSLIVTCLVSLVTLGIAAAPALAAGEAHPIIEHTGFETDTFSNPNGIAIDESTGDVYVADIGTDTVSKFTAAGVPIATWGANGQLTGIPTQFGKPAESFSFPNVYGTPAAIAIDNSKSPSDPSAGDLYVMDAGHGVVDKFSASGEYISQISGFAPATGSSEHELLGLAVDASGVVRVELTTSQPGNEVAVDEFDDSLVNTLIAEQLHKGVGEHALGVPQAPPADGFAVGPTGDDYLLYESCSCSAKFGPQLAGFGAVEAGSSQAGDVAVAVDPATGHLYADDQSSVAEWDTGAMNGDKPIPNTVPVEYETSAALVSRFGSSLSGSSGQGGIAVNGASGDIYVSSPGAGNPGEGKVYVFAGDAPAVTVGAATNVTKETATLSGTVNPREASLTSPCEFEYGVANEYGQVDGSYEHSVSCTPQAAAIGNGTTPVAVSAGVAGLEPGLLYRFRLKTENASGAGESSGLLATQGEGFGVKKFEVSFLNEDGSPDTQAGSHPYQLVNTIEFNSHYLRAESNADSPYVQEPDGTLKNLALDLPPGLVGDPNATSKKCTLNQLDEDLSGNASLGCPEEAFLGRLSLEYGNQIGYGNYVFHEPVYNMAPPRGVALQLGVNYINPNLFVNNGLLAGGDYPIQATIVNAPPAAPVLFSRLMIFGRAGKNALRNREEALRNGEYPQLSTISNISGKFDEERAATLKPFLTLPTGCHGPLRSTISVESYQGAKAETSTVTHNAAGTPVSLTGCSKLLFPPTISVKPDTSNASSSSGVTVGVHVPQTAAKNPEGLAESTLRDTTVALPAGVALNPSGAGGLEACSEGLADFEGFKEFNHEDEPGVTTATFNPDALEGLLPGVSLCPDGSKIGTVKIKTPLLEHELEGSVYLASQGANPFGSLVAMYMLVEDPVSGSTVKLTGEVQLCEAAGQVIDGISCQGQGQIVTTFKNTPDVPFENLELHFFGGERAPLSTPSRCGTYTTTAIFTPWDGNGPVTSESSFKIEHGPAGGPCPGASLPFSPSVTGGATNIQAGAFSPLTVTLNRKDGEQNLKSIVAKLPPGLSGVLTGVELCPEPRANEGLCGENSKVGEATISVGVGNQPFTVTGGKFYLTGPYNGSGACTVGQSGCAPFGLTFEVPAKAGPFDLENTASRHSACDCVVVRGKIELNPLTSAITITSDPPGSPYSIPTSLDGIPLEIQHVNATTTRGDFQFNPTNCAKMALEGTVQLSEGGSSTISTPFQVTNCAALKFTPKFAVSTNAHTSKADGASLTATVSEPAGSLGTQTNLAKVKVELPKQLPSRLTTLQKACTAKQFEVNPAACPPESKIGYAKVITPLVPVPLEGPAIFVSHGGEAFPSLTMVLQGYGVTIDLVGATFISKSGVTSTTFKTVPDQPFSSFALTLPTGKFSALTALGNVCAEKLTLPTEFIAQNGAEIHESTPITVDGCSSALSFTHSIKKQTLKLSVYAPAAGEITASGKGLTTVSKTAKGHENLTITLKQKKAGKLKTTVRVAFTPSAGKDRKKQAKSAKLTFKK